MRIFISWSGTKSLGVANALHSWLPFVINALEPWISSEDIDKGQRWGLRLSEQLENTKVGIICLTRDNLKAPWILFEAGALSKTLESTYVCPYLYDIEPSDLKGPLSQFQSTKAEKEDTLKLLRTINNALGDDSLDQDRLNKIFERWWSDLDAEFNRIREVNISEKEPELTEREMIKEILVSIREQKEIVSMSLTRDDINK